VPPSAVPPPIANDRSGTATKTIFGVVAPVLPPEAQRSMRPTVVGQPVSEQPAPGPAAELAPAAAAASGSAKKTGARKTKVPGPEIILPAAGAAPPAAAAASAELKRTTAPGYEQSSSSSTAVAAPAPAAAPEVELTRPAASAEDKTQPVRAKKKARGGSIMTYVGVGFLVGLALLGIYQLYGVLGH